jgi:hypothetical protein
MSPIVPVLEDPAIKVHMEPRQDTVIAQNEDLFIRQCRHKDSLTSSGGRERFTWHRMGKPGWSIVGAIQMPKCQSIPVSAKSLAVIPVIFSGDNVTRKVCSFCDLCEEI